MEYGFCGLSGRKNDRCLISFEAFLNHNALSVNQGISNMPVFKPAYIETFNKGLLAEKKEKAYKILKSCTLCPRRCRVNRLIGETGVCKTGKQATVSSFNSHFGEEDPLVGTHGSGTIFFTHCNLMCIFCQNYDISHLGHGEEVSDEQLADTMLHLQNAGCHNINFVTPSHVEIGRAHV